MEYTVKFRRFDFFTEETDPYRPGGEKILVPRYAEHGQRVSTEAQPEGGGNPLVLYGLREEDELRGQRLGAFFSDPELRARDILGLSDDGTSTSTPRPGQGRDPGATPHLEGAPISFENQEAFQIAAWIAEDDPSPDVLVQLCAASGNPEALGNKMLEAEHIAHQGEPREEVLDALTAFLGRGAARGPEGSEGVPGTALLAEGEAEPNDSTREGAQVEEGGVSEAAQRLIDEHSLNPDEIQGTGKGGRITQQDVQKHMSEESQQT